MLVTIGIIARDTYQLIYNFGKLEFAFIRNMANEVVFLFMYIEILKSAIIAKRHPEMYVFALAEVGFVISICNVIRSSILGHEEAFYWLLFQDLVSASLLLLMYKYIVPSRIPLASD